MKRVFLLLATVSVFLHLYAIDTTIYQDIHVWGTAGIVSYEDHFAELPLKVTYYIHDLGRVNDDHLRVAIDMTFELLTDHPAYVEGEEVTIHFVSPGAGKYSNYMVLNEYSVHRKYDFVLNEKTSSVSFMYPQRVKPVLKPRFSSFRTFSYIVTFSRYLFEADKVMNEELANHYRQIRLPIKYDRMYEIPETWKGNSMWE